jgi:hypothetical protein
VTGNHRAPAVTLPFSQPYSIATNDASQFFSMKNPGFPEDRPDAVPEHVTRRRSFKQGWVMTRFAVAGFAAMLASCATGSGAYARSNVDGAGAMFFQCVATGCVGNGALAPYLSGEFNVYDVSLTNENCTGAYVYMNGEFEGLAARSVGAALNDYVGK